MAMEYTKNKKNKVGYRLIDAVALVALIVVLLIVLYSIFLLIFGGFERFVGVGDKDSEKVELSYVICLEDIDVDMYGITFDVDKPVSSFLSVGDVLYNDGDEIGTISAIDYEDRLLATEYNDADGNVIYLPAPGKINILVTVSSTARTFERGYAIGELELYVGAEMTCSTSLFEKNGVIRLIEAPDQSAAQADIAG